METQKRLTLAGNIVISVGLFDHSGDSEVWENMDEGMLTATRVMLDDMYKRKIDFSMKRTFLDNDFEHTGVVNTIVYDRIVKGYRLETLYQIRLQNAEVFALCKILLDGRAFT